MTNVNAITMKAARTNAGLTQTEMASRLGVSVSSVSAWETGTVPITARNFKLYCEYVNMSMDSVIVP